MLSKIMHSKILVLVLSFVMACVLWSYVANVVNVEIEVKLNNVSVSFDGEEELKQKRSLQIIESRVQDVSLTISGRRSDVLKLDRKNVTAVVDLSGIRSSGDYSMAYSVKLPDSVSQDALTISRTPYYVQVSVAKMVTATVPVEGVLQGSVAENYLKGDFEYSPAFVEVSGPDSIVGSISKAVVTVTGNELTKSVETVCAYDLVDGLGESVDVSDLTMDTEQINVTLPVFLVKDVPLTVKFAEGDGITTQDVTWEVDPPTVRVYGTGEVMSALNEFILPTIDLTTMVTGQDFTFPIPISNDVTNISGEEEATVKVKIVGVATKTLTATNFVITNVPEGYEAQAARSSLAVTIRAPKSQIDYIEANNIRIVLDMSGADAYKGNQIIPATVYVDGFEDAGVVGDYTVAVSLTDIPVTPEED